MLRHVVFGAIGILALLAVTTHEASAQSKCSTSKTKAAGKKAASKLTCLAKAFQKGIGPDSTCLAKAEVKFSVAFAKAEAKVPFDCLAPAGDATMIESKIDGLYDDIDGLVGPPAARPCDMAKVKAAGKKANSKLGCHAKAVMKGLPATDSTCLAKAEVKFSTTVAKAEAKSGGVDCTATDDRVTYETFIDVTVEDVRTEIRPTTTTTTTTTTTVSTTTVVTTSSTTTTTMPGCGDCCSPVPTRFGFTTTAPQINVDPPCGTVLPLACAGGVNPSGPCTTNADCPGALPGTCTSMVCVGGQFPGNPCTIDADCPGISTGKCMGDLDCGGLYFGGSGVNVPLPSTVPDYGTSLLKVTPGSCTGGTFALEPTTLAETGDIRTCTSASAANPLYPACVGGTSAGKPCRVALDCPGGNCTGNQVGCLYGPPLPVPNANDSATSTCIINRITANLPGASGTCLGAASVSFNLASDLYLTGDDISGRPGIQPCPICDSGTLMCDGGVNHGLACTPGTQATPGNEYPTSHDCPPLPSKFIGSLPIPFALTTATSSKTAVDLDGAGPQGPGGFCGFCRSTVPPNVFRNPPQPCTSNATCTTSPFRRCQQNIEGAFGNGVATTYSETGVAAGCLDDNLPHAATLVSTFCIPPSYNGLVDGAADIPGPGAVSLPVMAQLF